MDAAFTSSDNGPGQASLFTLPPEVRQRIWKQLIPKERKIVQAARRKFPLNTRPDAPPEYTLTVRELNGGAKLPIILHLCRESRVLLPWIFKHASAGDKMKGIWWNEGVDMLYLDYDIVPHPEQFFRPVMSNGDPKRVHHLAVGLKLGADFVYRLELHNNLHTVSGTPDSAGDLATIFQFVNPNTFAIAYPSLPRFWLPSADQRIPLDIEENLRRTGQLALSLDPSYLRGDLTNNLVTVFNTRWPETALELLTTLKKAQDKLLADRLFYALLSCLIDQKRYEYQTIGTRTSMRWGLRRIEDLVYTLPSLRGSNQVLYVTPLMRFDDGPPTSWMKALRGYMARVGQEAP